MKQQQNKELIKMDGARIQAITKKEMNDEREEKEKLSKKRE
jgi:hypothetical protein